MRTCTPSYIIALKAHLFALSYKQPGTSEVIHYACASTVCALEAWAPAEKFRFKLHSIRKIRLFTSHSLATCTNYLKKLSINYPLFFIHNIMRLRSIMTWQCVDFSRPTDIWFSTDWEMDCVHLRTPRRVYSVIVWHLVALKTLEFYNLVPTRPSRLLRNHGSV